jgi:hypothetical protein
MKMAEAKVVWPSLWEELPADLIGLVLLRLPSLVDRARLRAVCRAWRAGTAAQLPPPLPWLALRDGGMVDLDGAPVRSAPILRDGVDVGFLAVDNQAFLVHGDGGCSLMNPLSGESGLTVPLPKLGPAVLQALGKSKYYKKSDIHKTTAKAVMSSPLHSSSDPLVAVLIMDGNGVAVSACKQPDDDATTIAISLDRPSASRIHDIAFFKGKLCALTQYEGLHVIELDASRLSQPKSSSGFRQCIADDLKQQEIYCTNPGKTSYYESYPEYLVMRYLAESNGRLLMVRRWMIIPPNAPLGQREETRRFEVFEADLTTTPGQWTKVESLGDQALFLGLQCSKSVLVGQCADGVQEDCIYFMHRIFDNPSREYSRPCVDPLADSGVYNMKDGEIAPLLPETVMAKLREKRQFLTWFFPADS